jgi:hypothetical protein
LELIKKVIAFNNNNKFDLSKVSDNYFEKITDFVYKEIFPKNKKLTIEKYLKLYNLIFCELV